MKSCEKETLNLTFDGDDKKEYDNCECNQDKENIVQFKECRETNNN